MELATAHVLTALYALAHRVALTGEELALLDERGRALTPAVWRETKDTLRLADRGGAGTELDLGFVPLVFEWLGVADTRAFAERYAVDIDEALAHDRGSLTGLADSIESGSDQPHEHFQLALSHAWSARAGRLMNGLPGTGEASFSPSSAPSTAVPGTRPGSAPWARRSSRLPTRSATRSELPPPGSCSRRSTARRRLASATGFS